MQKDLHELWLYDFSQRAIKEVMDGRAAELEWPRGEVPHHTSLAHHFANHLPIQMVLARKLTEDAAARQGAEAVVDQLATFDGFIDKLMNKANLYVNTDFEITSALELLAVVRFAQQQKEKITSGRRTERQVVDVTGVIMDLRQNLPAHYWNQLVERWKGRNGGPAVGMAKAHELPPGPEFSDVIPEQPETPRMKAARRLAEDARKRQESE